MGELLRRAGASDPRALCAGLPSSRVTRSGTTEVLRVETSRGAVYVKTYHYGIATRIKAALRGTLVGRTRARREWDALGVLEREGINAPGERALVEVRSWGFVTEAAIATEEVAGAKDLDRVMSGAARPEGAATARLARDLGHWVARMHGAGFFDGNLHFRNILMRSDGGAVTFHKIDSPRGRVSPSAILRESLRLCDLATLALDARGFASPKVMLAFLEAYAGGSWRSRKPLALRCERAADRLVRRRPRRVPHG